MICARVTVSLLEILGAARVHVAPLAAESAGYLLLAVADHEPMQVVTKGPPAELTFVTAGTNVCTVDVRAAAPVALLSAANC